MDDDTLISACLDAFAASNAEKERPCKQETPLEINRRPKDDHSDDEPEPKGSNSSDNGFGKQIEELMQNGFSLEEAEEAIKMSVGMDNVRCFLRKRYPNCLVNEPTSE